MSVRNPDSSGMPVVNKKCKLCTFVRIETVILPALTGDISTFIIPYMQQKKAYSAKEIGLFYAVVVKVSNAT